MSQSKMVPCPNGGRCGTRSHDPSLSQYAECLRASRASVSAMGGLAMPPSLSGSSADTNVRALDGSEDEYIQSVLDGLAEDSSVHEDDQWTRTWRSTYDDVKVTVSYKVDFREDNDADPEEYGHTDVPDGVVGVFAHGEWSGTVECPRDDCQPVTIESADPEIGTTIFEESRDGAVIEGGDFIDDARIQDVEPEIAMAVEKHMRAHA